MEIVDFKEDVGPGGYERLYLDHIKGGYKSSSREVQNIKSFTFIILGIIIQRKMWPKDDESGKHTGARGALCSSPNGINGIPQGAFDISYFLRNGGKPLTMDGSESATELLCQTCPFTEWSSDGPKCQERWYVPILVVNDENGHGLIIEQDVKIIEFTQSGIKPLKDHLSYMRSTYEKTCDYITRSKTIRQTSRNGKGFTVPAFTYNSSLELNDVGSFYMQAAEKFAEVEKKLFDSALTRSHRAPSKPAFDDLGSMG